MLAALVALGVMCWLLVKAGTGALIPLILTLAVVPLGTCLLYTSDAADE